jgi:ribosome-associated heat shock protein Hsp15
MTLSQDGPAQSMRLDKWLWAARFFKTRKLAVEAITGGKVHLNGKRVKPGREIRPGSKLEIHKGSFEWNITVEIIPKQRRPASETIHFYSESEESKQRRELLTEQQRRLRAITPHSEKGRPTKRDRRQIGRFIGKES